MRRHGPVAVLGLALTLVIAPEAHARVDATARLIAEGIEASLVVRATGDETLRCLRFTAADGVEVTGAVGPGLTQPQPPRGFSAQGFVLEPGEVARWTFTTRAPYPRGAGGGLDVSATCQPGSDVTVAATGPGAEPEVGRTEVVTVLRGTVLVRLRGTRRFVRVRGERAIPDGSEVDTRRGTVRLTVADGAGATMTAEVSEGRAVVDQDTRPQPTTTLRLSEPLACPRRDKARGAAKRRRRRRAIFTRTDGGRFRTRGRHAAAVATGTAWRTTDTCSRTVVDVREGTVRVTARSGRTVEARAGQRVIALPRRRGR